MKLWTCLIPITPHSTWQMRRLNRSPVVHQQKLHVLHIVNQKLHETAGKHVPRLLVRPVTNVRHQRATLELTTNPRVNTLRPPPVRLPRSITSSRTIRFEILILKATTLKAPPEPQISDGLCSATIKPQFSHNQNPRCKTPRIQRTITTTKLEP